MGNAPFNGDGVVADHNGIGAADIAPQHPGPPFFMGLALAQSGRLAEARTIWAALLERAPAEASYRGDLESRLARIDTMIVGQGGGAPVPPEPPPAATASPSEP